MKLARNAVFAIVDGGDVRAFLHINKDDLINPFWVSEHGRNGFSVHGELFKALGDAGGHEHLRGVCDGHHEIIMIQSHVASADKVDFKRCMNFFKKRTKR
ncbi:hypothetical protein STSR3_53 [Salmonella virus STSR3]|nr:hypothetical protein STSR3_53 [Salmonella virus STSR3]